MFPVRLLKVRVGSMSYETTSFRLDHVAHVKKIQRDKYDLEVSLNFIALDKLSFPGDNSGDPQKDIWMTIYAHLHIFFWL